MYSSIFFSIQFSSVQWLSCVRLFVTPWIAARQASLSINNSRSSLKTHVHRVSDAIQPSHPLSSPSPAPSPSQHQSLFQWVNFYAWGGQSTGLSALASLGVGQKLDSELPRCQSKKGNVPFATPMEQSQLLKINRLLLEPRAKGNFSIESHQRLSVWIQLRVLGEIEVLHIF